MNIRKTLLLASMALALVAFAAPTVAQANVVLTDPSGTALVPGDKFTATSENLKTTTTSGTLWCTHVQLHLKVVVNGPNHVVIEQEGTATTDAKACHLLGPPVPLPVTVTDGTLGVGAESRFTINTWGTGETKATFQSHIFGGSPHGPGTLLSTCHFEGSNVHVEATHPSGGNTLAVTGSKLTGTGAGCPAAGTIAGEFEMDTPNGKPVTLDYVVTT